MLSRITKNKSNSGLRVKNTPLKKGFVKESDHSRTKEAICTNSYVLEFCFLILYTYRKHSFVVCLQIAFGETEILFIQRWK